jgi:hypothetical protein
VKFEHTVTIEVEMVDRSCRVTKFRFETANERREVTCDTKRGISADELNGHRITSRECFAAIVSALKSKCPLTISAYPRIEPALMRLRSAVYTGGDKDPEKGWAYKIFVDAGFIPETHEEPLSIKAILSLGGRTKVTWAKGFDQKSIRLELGESCSQSQFEKFVQSLLGFAENEDEPIPETKMLQVFRGSHLSSGFPGKKVFEIDRTVFGNLDRPLDERIGGSEERSQAWFDRNRDCYVFVNDESTLIGYFAGLPLKKTAFDLVSSQKIGEGEISPDDVEMFNIPCGVSLFFANLSVLPRQPHRAYHMLSSEVFNLYRELAEGGVFITEIAANAWSYLGMELCEKMGMTLRCSSKEYGDAYYLDLTKVSVSELPEKNSFLKKLLSVYERYEDWNLLFKKTGIR